MSTTTPTFLRTLTLVKVKYATLLYAYKEPFYEEDIAEDYPPHPAVESLNSGKLNKQGALRA